MSPLHPRKVRRLLKHFKRVKTGKLPKAQSSIAESIKTFKEDFKPHFPKIVVETKEKQALNLLKKKVKQNEQEIEKDERRFYDLLSDISGLKGDLEEQEDIAEDQDSRIKELMQEIESRKPVVVQQVMKGGIEAPLMTKDKRVDTLQGSLLVMQNKLNQLINIKVREEIDKMKENKEKLNAIDKVIKKFEMKLIRLQGKHSQKKLKPLTQKITLLKKRYNELALKVKSKEKIHLKPVKLGKVPGLPQEKRRAKIPRPKPVPSTLELPDITQETPEISVDLPGPIPKVPVEIQKEEKKPGFFKYVSKEVKKFLHMGS